MHKIRQFISKTREREIYFSKKKEKWKKIDRLRWKFCAQRHIAPHSASQQTKMIVWIRKYTEHTRRKIQCAKREEKKQRGRAKKTESVKKNY